MAKDLLVPISSAFVKKLRKFPDFHINQNCGNKRVRFWQSFKIVTEIFLFFQDKPKMWENSLWQAL